MFRKWLNDEEGQALSEYGLLIAVIAIAVIAVMIVFRNRLAKVFQTATNDLEPVNATPQ